MPSAATPAGDVYVSGQGGPDTVGATGTSFLRYVTVKYRNGVTQWTDAHPYQGYVGVASATDSQCGLYVLGATSMTAIHYTDSCFTVGLDEPRVQRETLKVFPNPVANELAIPPSWANAAYAILDVGGRIVARGALPAKPVLDITHLPPAWYVLVLAQHERISRAPFVVCRP